MTKPNKLRAAAVYALAFAIPAGVLLCVYIAMGMAPWGDRTILVSDMADQYVEFFCALKQGELFFSWSKALGTSYIGVFSYYVSSPLSFLTLFVPNESMPVGLMFLVVLKVGLAGLSFAVFAHRRFPGSDGACLLGAICYGLMSYNIIYSICVMWLDGVIWLPLILLALERVLAGKGAGPFIAALTVCFFSTWYISYMVGAFCALYLCARLITLRPAWRALKGVLVRFFGGAACALGLTAWMWLPTLLAMFNGKFSGGNVEYDGLLACEPLELLGQLRGGQFRSITYGAPPYIFCGTAALALAVIYFAVRRVPLREKLANAGLLAAVTASMLLAPLDKAWHLFQRPNWFPFRYSFVFSFVLVYLAVQALGPLLAAVGKRGAWARRGAALALAAASAVQLGANAKIILNGMERQFRSASYQEYRDDCAANAQLAAAAKEDAGSGFFRMGATEDRGHNSPLAFGYPGITHYSSLYNFDVNRTLKELGFAQSWMWCAYYGSTPVTDALLGVKYVISGDDMPPGYEPAAQAGELTLWKNPDVLPLAFLQVEKTGGMMGNTPFERQNYLMCHLLGENVELFTPVAAGLLFNEGETVLTFTGSGKPVYADLSAGGLTGVLVNGERVLSLGSSEAASVHYLGTPEAGETWTVAVCGSGGWSGQLWELDQGVLHAAVEKLNNTEITQVGRDGLVRLTADSGGGQVLATTIPAEDGWSAYVDGKQTDTTVWLGAFLAVVLPAGEHQVELRYTAPGLVPGAALGAASAAALAALWALRRRKKA